MIFLLQSINHHSGFEWGVGEYRPSTESLCGHYLTDYNTCKCINQTDLIFDTDRHIQYLSMDTSGDFFPVAGHGSNLWINVSNIDLKNGSTLNNGKKILFFICVKGYKKKNVNFRYGSVILGADRCSCAHNGVIGYRSKILGLGRCSGARIGAYGCGSELGCAYLCSWVRIGVLVMKR